MAFELNGANLSFANLTKIIQEKALLAIEEGILETFSDFEKENSSERGQATQSFITAHALGFGPELPENIIKLALLLQTNNLLKRGPSVIQKATLNRVISFYNREVYPVILVQSTTKSQAAQLCLPFLGQGKVRYQGYELQSEHVLEIFSWLPLQLSPDEASLFLDESMFAQAYLANFLLEFGAYLPWFNYFTVLMFALSPESAEDLGHSLNKLSNSFADITQTWFQTNSDQENDLLFISQSEANLLPLVNHYLQELTRHTKVIFDNLMDTSEPPATHSFSQASTLAKEFKNQLLRIITSNQNQENNNSDKEFGKILSLTEQVSSLCFWGISQVGKVFNLASDNLTLAAYYHSEFFVPKEMVMEQLDKTINFIRTNTPITQT